VGWAPLSVDAAPPKRATIADSKFGPYALSPRWFIPALLEEYGDLPSEMIESSLHPVPVCVPLLLYNVLILTFGHFPTIQMH
jgi:hypothetical protein